MVGCKRKACRGKVWHASNICFFPHTHESHTVCNIACWAAHSKWDGPYMSFLCLIGYSPRVLEMVSGPFPLLPKLYYLYLTPPKKKGFTPCERECTIPCSRMVYVPKQVNSVCVFQYIDFMNFAIAKILL